MAIKITKEEFEKKFGQGVNLSQPQSGGLLQSAGNSITNAFKGGISQVNQGYNQSRAGASDFSLGGLSNIFEGATKMATGLVNTVSSPFAPIGKAIDNTVVQPLGNAIKDTSLIKGAAGNTIVGENGTVKYQENKSADRTVENISNINTIAGGVAAAMDIVNGIKSPSKRTLKSNIKDSGSEYDLGGIAESATDAKSGILNPQAADHMVSDLSLKFNKLKPGFGDGFAKTVDLSKSLTTEGIRKIASDYISKGGTITGKIADTAGAMMGTTKNASEAFGSTIKNTSKNISNAARDVVPTSERIVNHQVTHALDLTAGDVKNISLSTGHEVGQYLAEKNLIRENVKSTMAAVRQHFQENYDAVRSEIGKVQKVYKPSQIPRYVETLKSISRKINDVPGLQKVSVEVENLLNKKDIQLMDVQRVKELLDEHFNIYKATGDVGDSITKSGLDAMRKDLRFFIEKEVKNNTGVDIGKLNNSVATSKSIMDAVEARSTAGLTRGNLKLGDLGIFGLGMGMGGPLGGAALLFGKKLLGSPSVQLRIAKFMDGISDARKAAIAKQLESGKIPSEFDHFIKKKH